MYMYLTTRCLLHPGGHLLQPKAKPAQEKKERRQTPQDRGWREPRGEQENGGGRQPGEDLRQPDTTAIRTLFFEFNSDVASAAS